ncbi:hypothetical protein HNE_0603 [Hyphomonas neptunium ATCC 15444]|uniref:Lipoprotein n=2 Tax=Hyphomonas TaxID=85 RepID=Q0C4L1_HYPNA|nr:MULTISPECIES: hypothetical protein [Hyphomonas]ABI76914.1 hypothetical protein HNE_0603 [Hyphomonas neptunium ATCC 15444]KCZ96457.1 hypothetical protein HHI_02220 [Hyphomonas hirschiana VP5]
MRRRPLLTGLLLMGLALPAGADALLEKARAVSEEGPAYLFDMAFDDGEQPFTFQVDQTRPEGERVVAVTPASFEGDAAKRVERLKEETKGDIWCNSFTDSIPKDAKRISETARAATYSFVPLPGEEKEMRDIVKYLTGTATLDKTTGNVLSYELTAPKAFKPAMVAKVDAFSMKVACKAAPDGRSHVDTFALKVSGTAMMKPFSQNETRKVSNLKAAPESGYGAP